MQTQCPHCQTLFHVTDEQLQAADGQVRCGQCDEVFTADVITSPETPVVDEINNPELIIDELSIETLEEIQLEAVNIELPEQEKNDTVITELTTESEQEQEQEQETGNQPNLRLINSDTPTNTDDTPSAQAELNTVQVNTLSINTSLHAANTIKDETEETEEKLETEAATSGDDGYDPSRLYPELESSPAISSAMPSGYIVLSTLLILLFIGQSVYLLRDNLASHGFRPLMQTFCARFNCELALPRAPDKIILKRREIRSHPNVKNALSVKAVIINQAGFRQAYPLLEIQFHDIEGRIIAGRDFLPREYLPDDIDIKKGIAANNPVNIGLELIDPGKNAVSFLFIFK